ncbi:MAG: hypothetical protein M0T84_02375 [Betaproteobacteria bacterium]|nr:hypothetical protein [Betaproteobacteria bacterium]
MNNAPTPLATGPSSPSRTPSRLRRARVSGPATQRGQSTTEMAIAGLLLLVPAFLLIPLIGKLIDFKTTSLQAARYAAFERTVTSDAASVRGANFAQLTNTDLQNGTLMRFFSANGGTLSATQNSSTSAFAPRYLWVDQSLKPFMPSASDGSVSTAQSGSPAIADQTLGTILQALNDLSVGFDWNANGYYTAAVSATAQLPANVGSWGGKALTLPYDANPLKFASSDTLLTDSNSATGSDYVKSQVSKAVPTSLASFLTGALSLVSIVVPDLSGLKPGYVLVNSPQEIPCDRLSGGCSGGTTGPGTSTVPQSTIDSVETQMQTQGYTLQSQTTNSDGSVTLTFVDGASTVPVTLEPSGGAAGGSSTTTQQSTENVYSTAVTYYNSLTSAAQGWSGGPLPALTDTGVTSWQMTFTKTISNATETMNVGIAATSGGSTVTITTS